VAIADRDLHPDIAVPHETWTAQTALLLTLAGPLVLMGPLMVAHTTPGIRGRPASSAADSDRV
jgi:hypothetical protein